MDVTVCNDGHKCYNGSECVQKTSDQYGCDCATAYDHSAFSGHKCEHPATSYCEFGTSVSYRSFCSNNGVCKDYVVAGEDGKLEHPGCYCPAGFEGDHCQYLLGEGPKGYTTSEESPMYSGSSAYGSHLSSNQNTDNNGSSLSGFSVVVLYFSLLVFVCLAMSVTGCMKRQPKIKSADDIDEVLEPDGEELKKSIEEMNKKKTKDSSNDVTATTTTGDVEMVDMNGSGQDADSSVRKKSPLIKKLKKKSKVNAKASDEIGVVLDPDGTKLKESMVEEGHDIESLDKPVDQS